jgi:hypothetical protein
MMGTTPTFSLRYPEVTDPADVPLDMRELAEDVENLIGEPLDARMDAIEGKPASAYELIQTITLASAGAFTFSAIPQTYQDLKIRIRGRSSAAGSGGLEAIWMRLNGGASGYNTQQLYAVAAAVTAAELLTQTVGYVGWVPDSTVNALFRGTIEIEIPGYRDSASYPIWRSQGNASYPGGGRLFEMTGNWYGGGAVPVTTILLQGSNLFAAGSKASLYGIRA